MQLPEDVKEEEVERDEAPIIPVSSISMKKKYSLTRFCDVAEREQDRRSA
jgi:hypothetical protein